MTVLNESNLGVAVRDFFMTVGYWDKWLVAENEKSELYVCEERERHREVGTMCDANMIFVPVTFLSNDDFHSFQQEFLMEGSYGLSGIR